MTVKAFLRYLENPDGVRDRKKDEELSFERASSRAEYHLLLQTAKEMGARRAYLLIKTVVCLGIRTTEIAHLRADELTKETVWIPYRNKNRSIKIFYPYERSC